MNKPCFLDVAEPTLLSLELAPISTAATSYFFGTGFPFTLNVPFLACFLDPNGSRASHQNIQAFQSTTTGHPVLFSSGKSSRSKAELESGRVRV
jgi:hypothetical protein